MPLTYGGKKAHLLQGPADCPTQSQQVAAASYVLARMMDQPNALAISWDPNNKRIRYNVVQARSLKHHLESQTHEQALIICAEAYQQKSAASNYQQPDFEGL